MALSKRSLDKDSKRIYAKLSRQLKQEIGEVKAKAKAEGLRFTLTQDVRDFMEADVRQAHAEIDALEKAQ